MNLLLVLDACLVANRDDLTEFRALLVRRCEVAGREVVGVALDEAITVCVRRRRSDSRGGAFAAVRRSKVPRPADGRPPRSCCRCQGRCNSYQPSSCDPEQLVPEGALTNALYSLEFIVEPLTATADALAAELTVVYELNPYPRVLRHGSGHGGPALPRAYFIPQPVSTVTLIQPTADG